MEEEARHLRSAGRDGHGRPPGPAPRLEPAGGETRRAFLARASASLSGVALPAAPEQAASAPADLVEAVERRVVWRGRAGGTTWFHPRACMIRGRDRPLAFMTLQPVTGSDVFGPVHWTRSDDLGLTWSQPQEIPGLGRRPAGGGVEEGVCDVVPEYHAKTGTVLAVGHNVFYRQGRLARPQGDRHPVYVVRAPGGDFTAPRRLPWDDPRGSAIYTCGCGQRVTLETGDLLVPLSFGARGEAARSVGVALCAFDGRTLEIRKTGNVLVLAAGRGLLEPSLVRFAGRFYLTLRAEDGRGYAAASADGLSWPEPRPWCWDDGTPLAMSTTQQHWLAHGEGLFLVYTRRTAENRNVVRWRAPLFFCRVDTERLRLIRSTERVALPLIGDGVGDPKRVARMGNFHTTAAAPGESWVTVGEVLPDDGWRGDLLLARIRWRRPNRDATG